MRKICLTGWRCIMANRPAWTIENRMVICKEFEFVWNGASR